VLFGLETDASTCAPPSFLFFKKLLCSPIAIGSAVGWWLACVGPGLHLWYVTVTKEMIIILFIFVILLSVGMYYKMQWDEWWEQR
jgi:hypothetical protein